MIKMKKLICSLALASGGLFIAATASDAASISFTPTGAQLDNDNILDIATAPNQQIPFSILLNTFVNLGNPPIPGLVEIDFSVILDPTELEFLNAPGGSVLNLRLLLPPNLRGPVNFGVRVLNPNNDGNSDLSLRLNSAFLLYNGIRRDVANEFGGIGLKQIVEVQPRVPRETVPEPTTIFGSAIGLCLGGWLKRKNSSQQNKTNS